VNLLAARRRVPFLGLRFFDEGDADLFCGRGAQIDDLLEKLAQTRFVAVVGPSGSGKSSLVRAGLVPAIRALGRWRIATLRPGGNPIGELAAGLERTFPSAGLDLTLRRGRRGLLEAVEQCHLPPDEHLLVIVDQFEELFRFQRGADLLHEPSAFVKLLLEAASQRAIGVYALITMRSDYLGHCDQFRDLPERINEGLYLVPRMRRDQIEQAISGPLHVTGDAMAPRLIQRLLNDVGDDPDQLPVLQHALLRTWTRWRADSADGPIDVQHYEHRVVGGLSQALEHHADEIYGALSDSSKGLAETFFRRLTQVDDARAIRCPTSFQDLIDVCGGDLRADEARAVLDAFRSDGVSFVMPQAHRQLESQTVVDISHESLIRQWTRLRLWAAQEAADRTLYLEIEKRAGQATSSADDLTGVQLASAIDWLNMGLDASWARRYGGDWRRAVNYIERSRRAADDAVEATKQRERLFSLLVIVALFVLCLEAEDLTSLFALVTCAVAWRQWHAARRALTELATRGTPT
jgi:energy-coupling factor transporter ATP-binding protein EcfA2